MTHLGLRSQAPLRALDRAALLERFRRIRQRTRALFDVLDPSVYYARPIPLRNPVVFYEGHLPAFAVNTLVRKALGRRGVDVRLEEIFARGIDPDSEAAAVARGNPAWPSRAEVQAFAAAADRAVEQAIESADLVGDHPMLERAQALWTILEHEEMHQETLAYMWHEIPYDKKVRRGPLQADHGRSDSGGPPAGALNSDGPPEGGPYSDASPHGGAYALVDQVRIPAGIATLGTAPDESPFAWDNEMPAHQAAVPAFAIDVHNVTNAQFMEFVAAGGYADGRWWRREDWVWVTSARVAHPRFWHQEHGTWYWRGMLERVPLPASWPVYVTWAEANAFARWRGMRLPTEAEFHRAAFGTPAGAERRHPWGDTLDERAPCNCDFARWEPEPVGSRPAGASAFGVHDLVGNGWEWTSTVFGPFPGFSPLPSYPEYSADFFDHQHYVLKGASPATPRTLVRRGFRNWFRPHYPYVYATFRCVGPA